MYDWLLENEAVVSLPLYLFHRFDANDYHINGCLAYNQFDRADSSDINFAEFYK